MGKKQTKQEEPVKETVKILVEITKDEYEIISKYIFKRKPKPGVIALEWMRKGMGLDYNKELIENKKS